MKTDFFEKRTEIKRLKNVKGINNMLEHAFQILGHPMVVIDTSYQLLATNNVTTDDWVWNEIQELGTFKHETVDFFNKEGFIEAFDVSETVTLMKSKHLKYERINGKLFDKDGVQLGNLSVVACKTPFQDGDLKLIETLCEILSVELQNSEARKSIDRVFQKSPINTLITGESTVKDLSNDTLAELYDGLKPNLFIAVIDIIKYDKTNTHLAYFRDLFKKLASQHKYYVHLNNVVALISTDNEMICIQDELQTLKEFFEKNNICAGISGKFQNLQDLKNHFKQAIVALHCGLDSKRASNIFCYDDFRIEHFLVSAHDDTDEICSPIVSLIKEYDNENDSNLLDALYAYLLNGMNLTPACKLLNTSEETLLGKLRELEDVFKIDWTNGDSLYNIFMSIKLTQAPTCKHVGHTV